MVEQWEGVKFMWSGLVIGLKNWRCVMGRHPSTTTIDLPGGGTCTLCDRCEEELGT